MLKISAAAAGMAVLVWLTDRGMTEVFEPDDLMTRALTLTVPVLVGVGSYLAFALAFETEEVAFVRHALRRRVT